MLKRYKLVCNYETWSQLPPNDLLFELMDHLGIKEFWQRYFHLEETKKEEKHEEDDDTIKQFVDLVTEVARAAAQADGENPEFAFGEKRIALAQEKLIEFMRNMLRT